MLSVVSAVPRPSVACVKNSCQRRRKRSSFATSALEGEVPRCTSRMNACLKTFGEAATVGIRGPSVAIMSSDSQVLAGATEGDANGWRTGGACASCR